MLRKIFVVFGFILVVILCGLGTLGVVALIGGDSLRKEPVDELSITKVKRPIVRTQKVSLQDVNLSIKGDGRVNAQQMVKVTGETQGRILSGRLKKGASFSKGQLLYSLDKREYSLGIKARKSSFITMVANVLPDIKLDYPNEFDKWMKFYVSINPEKTLGDFPDIKTNQEKTFIASKGILAEYYNLRSMEEKLTKYSYYAPFSGSVTASYADIGTIINPGSPVIDIIQRGQLEVEVSLSMEASKKVKTGTLVRLLDKTSGQSFTGRVTRKGAFINVATQSVPVYISVSGGKDLYNGMYLSVEFPSGVVNNAMEIPSNAITENHVYIVKDSLALKRAVEIYSEENGKAFVLGLKNDEKVIVEPVTFEKDSVKVKPVLKTVN